jgi:hypothetical protein
LFALFAVMLGGIDQWLQLAELAELFGLSEESIKRLAKSHGFPLRRLTPYATPGSHQIRVAALVESSTARRPGGAYQASHSCRRSHI